MSFDDSGSASNGLKASLHSSNSSGNGITGRTDRAGSCIPYRAEYESISEIHRCEPYVYAQTIVGPDGRDHGRARNSWLTGTASWGYVAMTQWILGVRPTFDGLRVDPCVPADLLGYRVIRRFRGTTYDIRVENPEGVTRGVREIRLDGTPIRGPVLPVLNDQSVHDVRVVMGGNR